MTNIDHATEIIADAFRPGFGGAAPAIGRDLAHLLADAGLLAPDLPEPETKPAGWASAPPGTNISEWAVDGLTRAATLPDGTILVHDDGLDVAEDPDTLESIALAYLAAVRAARQALEAPMPLTDDQAEGLTNDRWNLPSHRTEAGYPNCSTCDGGGCPDCTDPA